MDLSMSCELNMKFNLHLGNVMFMFFLQDSYVNLMKNFHKQGIKSVMNVPLDVMHIKIKF
jgi:hypothetical protein